MHAGHPDEIQLVNMSIFIVIILRQITLIIITFIVKTIIVAFGILIHMILSLESVTYLCKLFA